MRWTTPHSLLASLAASRRSTSTFSSASCYQPLTYTLGNSNHHVVYVPLTSYCNSVTLPQTRGPNFRLPPNVVASLCRIRDVESGISSTEGWWKQWWSVWLDHPATSQKMPAKANAATVLDEKDSDRRPTVDELVAEVKAHLLNNKPNGTVDWTIVIAGEGEPTLRLNALIALVERLRDVVSQHSSSGSRSSIRITTNGLLDWDNTQRLLQACSRGTYHTNALTKIPITFSVALMTHDPDQYDELMQPCRVLANNDEGNHSVRPHDQVQNFIRAVVAAGMEVETTAVDRPDVNKERTNRLSVDLGVADPVRWRIYYP